MLSRAQRLQDALPGRNDDSDAMCKLHAGVPQTLILFGRRLLCTWHGMEASEWSPLTLRCTDMRRLNVALLSLGSDFLEATPFRTCMAMV